MGAPSRASEPPWSRGAARAPRGRAQRSTRGREEATRCARVKRAVTRARASTSSRGGFSRYRRSRRGTVRPRRDPPRRPRCRGRSARAARGRRCRARRRPADPSAGAMEHASRERLGPSRAARRGRRRARRAARAWRGRPSSSPSTSSRTRVFPSWSFAFTSAPASSKRRTTSRSAAKAAWCSAVRPFSSRSSRSGSAAIARSKASRLRERTA